MEEETATRRFIIDERTQHQMSGINQILMDSDAFHGYDHVPALTAIYILMSNVLLATSKSSTVQTSWMSRPDPYDSQRLETAHCGPW